GRFEPPGRGCDVNDVLIAELRSPGGVLDRLRDGVAQRLVTLEFEDDQVPVRIDSEQVEPRSPRRGDLAPDNEHIIHRDGDVLFDPVLEMLFEIDTARAQAL